MCVFCIFGLHGGGDLFSGLIGLTLTWLITLFNSNDWMQQFFLVYFGCWGSFQIVRMVYLALFIFIEFCFLNLFFCFFFWVISVVVCNLVKGFRFRPFLLLLLESSFIWLLWHDVEDRRWWRVCVCVCVALHCMELWISLRGITMTVERWRWWQWRWWRCDHWRLDRSMVVMVACWWWWGRGMRMMY